MGSSGTATRVHVAVQPMLNMDINSCLMPGGDKSPTGGSSLLEETPGWPV